MLYYETDERRGKAIGAAAALAYVVFWVLLMFLVTFKYDLNDVGEGILIDFGDTESASGTMDPANNYLDSENVRQTSNPVTSPEEYLTQDHEEAPEIQQPNRSTQNRTQETNRPANNTPQQQATPQEQPREVNRQALFPGRTDGSTSTSEGTAENGAGNQGAPEGSPQGSHEGTGTGGGGTGFDLAGRSVVGSLPQPAYGANKQGRVIIEIVVDAAGIVTNASYRARGSTTNDSQLVNAALKAARQSRFNKIDGDGLQTGTITYNFKLK